MKTKWHSKYQVGSEGGDCEMNLQGLDTCCALSLHCCDGDDNHPESECDADGQCFHRNACEFCKEYRRQNKGNYYYPRRKK